MRIPRFITDDRPFYTVLTVSFAFLCVYGLAKRYWLESAFAALTALLNAARLREVVMKTREIFGDISFPDYDVRRIAAISEKKVEVRFRPPLLQRLLGTSELWCVLERARDGHWYWANSGVSLKLAGESTWRALNHALDKNSGEPPAVDA